MSCKAVGSLTELCYHESRAPLECLNKIRPEKSMKASNFMKAIGKSIALISCTFATLYCVQVGAQGLLNNGPTLADDLAKADDTNGFVVSSDATTAATADRLYKINLKTGEPTMIGPLGPVGGVFEDVEGLALDTTGKLFGIDDDTKTLLTISATSGFATAVNNTQGNTRLTTGLNPQDLSIAFSCAGQLYAAAINSKTLYRVNTSTGLFEVVGAGGALIGGITDLAVANSQMYGLGADKLYRVDVETGISSLVGSFGSGINFLEGGGLASDSSGQLWASAERRDARLNLLPSQIYRINADTGAATLSTATPVEGIESLVIGPPHCVNGSVVLLGSVPSLNFFGGFILLCGVLLLGRRFS